MNGPYKLKCLSLASFSSVVYFKLIGPIRQLELKFCEYGPSNVIIGPVLLSNIVFCVRVILWKLNYKHFLNYWVLDNINILILKTYVFLIFCREIGYFIPDVIKNDVTQGVC